MDARTGLGRFRHFRISNYQLMMDLIEYCQRHTINEILALPDVKERADLFLSHGEKFEEQVRKCARHHGPLTILDLRNEDVIYTGNRFMVYALFPDCQISIHLMWGRLRQNTVFATGKSIFYRDNPLNIGELMLSHGGGGHSGAGTCQVEHHEVEDTTDRLIKLIQEGCRL
jgi:nanoRNase/pAp phosphatase (c-di-AMP/oligoRNAs hydrolase)